MAATQTTRTGSPRPRKVVQIAVAYDSNNELTRIIALCNDGTIWRYSPRQDEWTEMTPVPGTDA